MKYSHRQTKYIGKQVGLRTYQLPAIAFVLKVKPSKNGSDAEDKPNIPGNLNLEEHHCENLPPRKRFEVFCITEFTN